jgi:hypothetical protein
MICALYSREITTSQGVNIDVISEVGYSTVPMALDTNTE